MRSAHFCVLLSLLSAVTAVRGASVDPRATHGTQVKGRSRESMSSGERAYVKALNEQSDEMTKSAQSRGYNQKFPRLLFAHMPEANRKYHGSILVGAIVTTEGKVVIENGIEAIPPELRATITDALAHWRFDPAKIDDKPVNLRIQIPLQF